MRFGSQAALVPDHGSPLFVLDPVSADLGQSAYVNKALSVLLAGTDHLTTASPSQGGVGHSHFMGVSAHSYLFSTAKTSVDINVTDSQNSLVDVNTSAVVIQGFFFRPGSAWASRALLVSA
ncbi:unnamed protein product (mitochondrion) [Plasmodiophora brassicae]|uniref:Uncharacterized protein n=1 Tax=Plasmodiophora brassicae TaxID=37360 RepID=A0A3P3Y3C3_PLABS|nr:unnamed protein product [Plasmodiophora brassicae]